MNRKTGRQERQADEQMVLESLGSAGINKKAAVAEGVWEGKRIRIRGWMSALSPYILTIVLLYVCRRQGEAGRYWRLIMQDALLTLCCFVCYLIVVILPARRKGKEDGEGKVHKSGRSSFLLLIPVILMLFVFDYICCIREDRPVKKEFYKEVTNTDVGELTAKAVQGEKGLYRTEQLGTDEENAANLNRVWDMDQYLTSAYSSSYNEDYRKFREEIFRLEEPFRNYLMFSAVHNPVYQRFMGVKYVLSKEPVPGYEAIESKGSWKVYQNEQVSPAAYVTNRVITEKDYSGLEFPYNQLALLEYAVTGENTDVSAKTKKVDISGNRRDILASVRQIKADLPEMIAEEENKKVYMDLPYADNPSSVTGDVDESDNGLKVLFLKFQIENLKSQEDVSVWVEGIRNKLTARSHLYYNGNTEFTYAVPLEVRQESVEIIFGKGKYKIKNAEAYTGLLPGGKYNKAENQEEQLYQSVFEIDRPQTKGGRIVGNIEVREPGYFITTIPYDENFEIRVDGLKVKGERVNTAFLGFKIGAGEHKVQILYHAPGVKVGKIMSVAGIVLFLILHMLQKRRKTGESLSCQPTIMIAAPSITRTMPVARFNTTALALLANKAAIRAHRSVDNTQKTRHGISGTPPITK